MSTGLFTPTTEAPVSQDSPLCKVVADQEVDDTGQKRQVATLDGGRVPDEYPLSARLNLIADATEAPTRRVKGEDGEMVDLEITKAEAQARALVDELHRAAGQLKVHLRTKRAVLRDGRQAVSFWRTSKASTRGRKAGENGQEDASE